MPQSPRIRRLIQVMNGWSRSQRISLNLACSIILTMVLGYLLRIIFFDDPTGDFTFYWIGVSLLAVGISAAGWFWLVGFDLDEKDEWRAGAASVYFLLAGAFGFVLILLGILAGLTFGFII